MTQATDATRARGRATIIALAVAAMMTLPATAIAQHSPHASMDSMPGMDGTHATPSMQGETDAAMSGPMAEMSSHRHMRMSVKRPATAADSARARAIADTLRRVLANYCDVSVAEADGFRMFAPRMKQQH